MQVSSSRRWILFYFCAANILVSFNISALTAVIPAISRSLNISANDAAGIIPYYMIPYGIGALLFAPLASRFSIKLLMMMALLLYTAGNLLSLWVDSLPIILTGRVISGLGASAVTPLALMTLGKVFEKEIRGRVLGIFFSCSFFGAMLGLMLSGVAPWHWLFAVPIVLGVILFCLFFACPSQGMEANRAIKVNYLEAINISGLRRLLIFIFLMSLFFHGVCKWYGVFLDRVYDYNQITISALIILTALTAAIGQLVAGVITDKWGRIKACYIGIIIISIFIMALWGKYSLLGIGFILSMISVGWTIAHNGVSTLLTDFPDTYRSELAGLNSSVRFLSGGIGFWLSGSFMESNFGLTFFVIGALMLSLIFFIPSLVVERKEN